MLLEREKTERSLKCSLGKAYNYGKTLSLLASVLDKPQDKGERVRKEMNVPK